MRAREARRGRGRPDKLTEDRQARICDALRAGLYAIEAAAFAGIGESTFYDWLARARREPDSKFAAFAAAVQKASVEAEVQALTIIRRAMRDDWEAAIGYLERRYPDRWRRRRGVEQAGDRAGPIRLAPEVAEPLRNLTAP
ncbi:MAG: hypothetical protein ACRDLL_12980 [Solirubrobacterales bacterium]